MTRPWMPLYVADYRADTAHLGALEHGIYLLLIMHYWQTGGLPDDDRQLARIGCATDTEWRRARPIVEKFFAPGWKHGRIERELLLAQEKYERRAEAGRRGGLAKAESLQTASNASSNATAGLYQSQSPSQLQKKESFKNGEVVSKGWTPPAHGRTGKGRVYIEAGTEEWKAYAEDFRAVNHRDPEPNRHGGKWFKTLGEASQ